MSEVETKNEEIKVEKDSTLNLQSLMSNTEETPVSEEKEVLPIDEAIKNKQSGIVATDEEMKASQEEGGPLKNVFETPERDEDVKEKVNELNETTEKAKLVTIIRKPRNQGEDAEMMSEIDSVTVDENGNVIVPEGAKYIIPREVAHELKKEELKEEEIKEEESKEPVTMKAEDVTDEDLEKAEKRKTKINIIIDKTGLGRDVAFTDKENKLITESNEIHVTEVENLELETMEIDYANNDDDDMSFMDDIEKHQLSVSKQNMVFPASGFKADLLGLSWGELADITIAYDDSDNEDYLNYDKMRKKATVVYKRMTNISCGAFESFDDFLKKFAFVDLNLATYGLVIATNPEKDSIGFRCQKKECGKQFNHTFLTRSLIDFDTAGDKYLEEIRKIAEASSYEEYVKIAESSDVRKVTRMKLPTSKYVLEVGPISMYDYLENVLSVINRLKEEEEEAEEEGKEFDDVRVELSFLLQVVRAINIPTKSGKYRRITNGMKMLNILAEFTPSTDIEIISAIYQKCIAQYGVEFSVKNVVCPDCGYVTGSVPVTPDELVFYARQRLINTSVVVDNFPEA